MFYNAQIKINIQGYGNAYINYSYHDNTCFQDLLEYVAYLIPSANICQCSKFKYYDYDYNYDIPLDKKVYNFKNQFNKLCLNKNKKNCKCNAFFLNHSKYLLFQNYMSQINNLEKKNNLNEQKISSLEQEKKYNINNLENLQKQNFIQNIQINNL